MKIVFLTSSLNAGGAERVASTLCNAWAVRGDSVTLIPTYSGGGAPFYALEKEVELIYLASVVSGNGKSLLGYMRRLQALRKLIVQRKPDVVISFLPNVNVAAVAATVFIKTPLIICERSDPSCRPRPLFLTLVTRIFYRYANALLVQTEAVAKKSHLLFPKVRKILAIANPLPETLVMQEIEKVDRERKVLLSLGRLSSEKQVHFIIEAFSRLAPDITDWDLHIVGDGPERLSLENLVAALGLQGRVFFKGKTTEPWSVMSQADIFVMASKYEGFPNALLEAMGVGLPCVTFDTPSGPRELSENGENALLVPMNDVQGLVVALQSLMANEKQRAELGQKARSSVLARYRLPAVLAEWDELFGQVSVANKVNKP